MRLKQARTYLNKHLCSRWLNHSVSSVTKALMLRIKVLRLLTVKIPFSFQREQDQILIVAPETALIIGTNAPANASSVSQDSQARSAQLDSSTWPTCTMQTHSKKLHTEHVKFPSCSFIHSMQKVSLVAKVFLVEMLLSPCKYQSGMTCSPDPANS